MLARFATAAWVRTFCAQRLHTPAHAFRLISASLSTSRTARFILRCALNFSRFWNFWPFFTGSDMANGPRERKCDRRRRRTREN